MTVHRQHVQSPRVSTKARIKLGRVLVTTDDLRTLCELLDARKGVEEAARIHFLGGWVDEPEDLKLLTPSERSIIRVVAPDVMVYLEPSRAEVRGTKANCDLVFKKWAAFRETKLWPDDLPWVSFGGPAAKQLLGIGVVLAVVSGYGFLHAASWRWWTGVPALLILGFCIAFIVGFFIDDHFGTAAVVKPLSLAELR